MLGPVFLQYTLNSEQYISDILSENTTEEELMYGYFMQDCATARTLNHSINVLN
jgi:hypothetical protein